MKRQIIHVDIDAFFASVEQLDNPELMGKPVIVGGTGPRGVVSTASYEAREYGVHSAMSGELARKKCPQGIFVHGNHKRYSELSKEIFTLIQQITPNIEKVSIDEAYIDVTDVKYTPWTIAVQIQNQVKEKTGLGISVGISYNKFLAKLASDWKKPMGIFEIKEDDVEKLLRPLEIRKIHGLGRKSVARLNNIGIFTVNDLYEFSREELSVFLGVSWATEIYYRIRGIDNRRVGNDSQRKSIGKETTYLEDVRNREVLWETISSYLVKLVKHLEDRNEQALTVTIKFKYKDFEQHTVSHTLNAYTNNLRLLEHASKSIFDNIVFQKPVRLIGITLSNLEKADETQLSFL